MFTENGNKAHINHLTIDTTNNDVSESYIQPHQKTQNYLKQDQNKASNQNGVYKIHQKCEDDCGRVKNQNYENESKKIVDDQIITGNINDHSEKNEENFQQDKDLILNSSCQYGDNEMEKQINEDCELVLRLIKEQRQIKKQRLNKKQQIKYKQLNICLKQLFNKGYRIKSYISEGGEGLIFKGYSKSNEEVAIKLSFFQKEIDNATLVRAKTFAIIKEQYDKETMIKDNIKCFNYIVKTHEFFVSNKIIVSVMEYFPSDLKTKLIKEKNLTQKDMIKMMFQLLNSLIELHMNGIAHYDIKPENILIKENGEIKITDFGISEIYEEKKSCGGLTEKYSSPEQFRHKKKPETKINFSSDIFSMGLTFLNILGYDFKNEEAIKIRKNKWEEINFPQENKNHFTFIKYYMLNKNPNLRFRATYLKMMLNYYYKEYIDTDGEIKRIENLINEKTDLKDIKYSSMLNILLSESTKREQDLIKSLQMYENLKDLTPLDKIHFQLVHVRSLVRTKNTEKMKEVLEEISKEINEQFMQNIDYLYYLTNFGNLYEELEQYQKSLEYYQLDFITTDEFFKKDYPFISQSYQLVARGFRKIGKLDLALEMSLKSLEMREKYWEGDHPDFYESFASLYYIYKDLANKYKSKEYKQKAEEYKQKALKNQSNRNLNMNQEHKK